MFAIALSFFVNPFHFILAKKEVLSIIHLKNVNICKVAHELKFGPRKFHSSGCRHFDFCSVIIFIIVCLVSESIKSCFTNEIDKGFLIRWVCIFIIVLGFLINIFTHRNGTMSWVNGIFLFFFRNSKVKWILIEYVDVRQQKKTKLFSLCSFPIYWLEKKKMMQNVKSSCTIKSNSLKRFFSNSWKSLSESLHIFYVNDFIHYVPLQSKLLEWHSWIRLPGNNNR